MRKKILSNYIFILLISAILTGILAYQFIRINNLDNKKDKLISSLKFIESSLNTLDEQPNTQNYFRLAQEYSEITGLRITFFDTKGFPLADSLNNSIIFQSYFQSPDFQTAYTGNKALIKEFSKEIGEYYFYYTSRIKLINTGEVILRLGEPTNKVDRVIDQFILYLVISIFIGLVVASIVSLITVNRIVKPLKQLSTATQKIAKGDFELIPELDTADEIGDLTDNFNVMTLELKRSIEAMKEVERMRKDFVANVSHELRTPLTSIIGFVETLKLDDLDQLSKNKALDIIESETARLKDMINKLLVLSNVESMKIEKSNDVVSFESILSESLVILADEISRKKLKVASQVFVKPQVIKGGELPIRMIFKNLLENSIKYSKENGNISIEILEINNMIRIRFYDEGIGIAAQELDRIFERFYRVNESRNSASGSGLGLAITKHLVSQMNGTIEVESTINKGSIFTVYIPKFEDTEVNNE